MMEEHQTDDNCCLLWRQSSQHALKQLHRQNGNFITGLQVVDSISKLLRIPLVDRIFHYSSMIQSIISYLIPSHTCFHEELLAFLSNFPSMSNHTTLNLSSREGSERREKRKENAEKNNVSPVWWRGKRKGGGGGFSAWAHHILSSQMWDEN